MWFYHCSFCHPCTHHHTNRTLYTLTPICTFDFVGVGLVCFSFFLLYIADNIHNLTLTTSLCANTDLFFLFNSQTRRVGTTSSRAATASVFKRFGCATGTTTVKTVQTNTIARTLLVRNPSSRALKTTIASRLTGVATEISIAPTKQMKL